MLRSTAPGPAVYEYTFQFQMSGPHQPYTQRSLTCSPSRWVAGEGVVLSLALPADNTGVNIPHVSMQILRVTHSWYRPTVGSVTFETAQETYSDDVLLPVGRQTTPGYANLAQLTATQINAATFPVFYQRPT